jgi:hypothetical protein
MLLDAGICRMDHRSWECRRLAFGLCLLVQQSQGLAVIAERDFGDTTLLDQITPVEIS